MLPHIISAVGAAISADEIAAVQRVICTRSIQQAGIYKVLDQLTGVLVEFHPYKNTAYTTPGGISDYVGVAMPNPVPYRGVSIGVVDKGVPSIAVVSNSYVYGSDHGGPLTRTDQTWTVKNSAGTTQGTGSGSQIQLASFNYSQPYPDGSVVPATQYNSYYVTYAQGVYLASITNGLTGASLGVTPPSDSSIAWWLCSGMLTNTVRDQYFSYISASSLSFTPLSPSYKELLAADIAADIGGTKTYVMASDGEVLASEVQNEVVIGGHAHTRYAAHSSGWSGGSSVWMWDHDYTSWIYDHKLSFNVPEDCVYPEPPIAALYPGTDVAAVIGGITNNDYPEQHGYVYPYEFTFSQGFTTTISTANSDGSKSVQTVAGTLSGGGVRSSYTSYSSYYWNAVNVPSTYAEGTNLNTSSLPTGFANGSVSNTAGVTTGGGYTLNAFPSSPSAVVWNSDWQAGVAAFKLRRKNWLKKNSDEFISAAKKGFAPGAPGVTRQELQTGLPTAWQTKIKTDVDNRYNDYPKDIYNLYVGRHTSRAIRYSENGFAETVVSDTSNSLAQAGIKVTKRVVTLRYTIAIDGEPVTREVAITGYLTQTGVEHFYSDGTFAETNWRNDYDTWYIRLTEGLPIGVTTNAVYMKDRTLDMIGYVLNGTLQDGYNSDSLARSYLHTLNRLTYAGYTPALPAWSSNVTADIIDGGAEFTKTWHKEAKITYDKTGAGASNEQNDSAMHGVTEVHITPVGMIADFTTNISKSGTLNGYPGNNGHLKAGTYYGRVFALSKDGTEFIKCSAVKKVVTTNADTEAGEGTNSILWQWTKMTYVDTDGVTKDVTTYYLHVWSVPDGTGTWYHPGSALSGTQNDMTMGYSHPFGTVDSNKIGIFHGVSGAMDGNRLRIYGTAIYKFDWDTGALTFKSWKPLTETDGDGNTVEIPHRDVTMAGAQVWSDSQINCIITYKGLHWPDVITAIKARDKDMSSGTFTYSDPTLNELIKAIKAG